uniref:Uncharacterized protein n=1 Tax=Arundo donax TaxID=35708 RepID=A0A0A9AGY7_ARUDO
MTCHLFSWCYCSFCRSFISVLSICVYC